MEAFNLEVVEDLKRAQMILGRLLNYLGKGIRRRADECWENCCRCWAILKYPFCAMSLILTLITHKRLASIYHDHWLHDASTESELLLESRGFLLNSNFFQVPENACRSLRNLIFDCLHTDWFTSLNHLLGPRHSHVQLKFFTIQKRFGVKQKQSSTKGNVVVLLWRTAEADQNLAAYRSSRWRWRNSALGYSFCFTNDAINDFMPQYSLINFSRFERILETIVLMFEQLIISWFEANGDKYQ